MDPFPELTQQRREYSVGELTAEIGELLTDAYSGIYVRGEISGLKLAASGHAYFTLKDDRATLRAACWKGAYRLLRFKPKDGAEVLVRGRIEVYEPRGEYQLIVESIEPVGAGALQAAFEKLKAKLAAEGLFDADRKRALPRLPRHIGIVTSPTGAVIRDILHVIERRFPGLHIRLYPAQVQGAGAAAQVVAGLDYFSSEAWADVVILARGGGSLEDLWTFNEEDVARAIARCAVPVISAIGHETDFTIADFVADRRAPTPSAAAEIVTESREAIYNQVLTAQSRIGQAMRLRLSRAARRLSELGTQRAQMTIERKLFRAGQRLDDAGQALREALRVRVAASTTRLEVLDRRLRRLDLRLRLQTASFKIRQAGASMEAAMGRRLALAASKSGQMAARLNALNPLQILDRGFAVVSLPDGRVLRRQADAPPGTKLKIRLAEGAASATTD
ncbi:MAG: exodeoxyribonuclease VII large subunit [Bryobacterales bacterium]|nr:exodeoxyribonuclease VII large subunit [Bryobacterales bacterium]